jgi:hypothetical protein
VKNYEYFTAYKIELNLCKNSQFLYNFNLYLQTFFWHVLKNRCHSCQETPLGHYSLIYWILVKSRSCNFPGQNITIKDFFLFLNITGLSVQEIFFLQPLIYSGYIKTGCRSAGLSLETNSPSVFSNNWCIKQDIHTLYLLKKM